MMLKPKNWIAETLWKPKKTHSLEQLRYLHYVLQRNSTVTEANKSLVVETLRSIAEILIWGDQNDSTVFDFFLEKNMLLFFLKFMTQSCGSYVTVQLLQTLNILFENIRHETSLYFLLSNNHVNSIIVHKFDFSNEEVLAYYISFLKTLSLKLNRHTINFFFNERKSDFPLYTEGIKFFHHTESMVRIAVRTLTLNVYKVGHEKMLEFICDKTATPYFSNLIWFIGKHAIELDDCLTQESDHFKIDKLKSIVADHLDHLHYLQDILTLKINMLNIILTDHMVNRLVIPLYIYSLPNKGQLGEGTYDRVMISKLCALFLLTQHLLIMDHPPLVNAIVDVIFNEDDIRSSPYMPESPDIGRKSVLFNGSIYGPVRAFVPPPAPLESQLEASGITKDSYNLTMKLEMLTSDHKKRPPSSTFFVAGDGTIERTKVKHRAKEEGWSSDTDSAASYSSNAAEEDLLSLASQADRDAELAELEVEHAQKDSGELRSDESLSVSDVTRTSVDAEKLVEEDGSDKGFDDLANSRLQPDTSDATTSSQPSDRGNEDRPISKSGKGESSFTMEVAPAKPDRPRAVDEVLSSEPVLVTPKRVFLQTILQAFDCANGDCEAFFALCLVYTMLTNSGLRRELLRSVGITVAKDARDYNDEVLERMLALLEEGVRDGSKMRLVTFEMCLKVIRLLVIDESAVRLKDRHLAMIENIKEASTLQLRNFYKDDDMFLDMFEGEYHQMKAKPLNVEYLTMDASLLLQPTATPLTGIDFLRRLPCGDTERTQRAARVFILMRELVLDVTGERELYLPLSYVERPVKENEVLDLNNSDLIACTIVQPSKQSVRRFMVIDSSQFILVEPDTSKLGWGVVKFVAHLQDVEANPDKDDSRSLYLVVQQPFSRRSKSGIVPIPLLTARFVFDDYIRCMSARQRLQKRRDALRHHKMSTVARLLELPVMAAPPSHYYTIAPYESSSTVWSPSSRAYTGARAVKSSPIVSQEVGQNLNLSLPAIALKTSTLLSPKHTEILQKQIKQDRVDGDLQDVEPSASSTPVQLASQSAFDRRVDRRLGVSKSQAQTLASVLDSSDGPEEYFGCSEVRRRSSTVESAEEEQELAVTLSEQDSSFIPMNVSASVERSVTAPAAVPRRRSAGPAQKVKATKISAKASSATSTKTKPAAGPTAVCDDAAVLSVSQERGRPVQAHADDRRHVPSKCQSAPGSPRGRRSRSEKERSLSEVRDARSLSAIGLETLLSGRAGLPTDQVGESDEARRQKAIRARAKVKTLKTKKLRR